jgi:hypothetical protein
MRCLSRESVPESSGSWQSVTIYGATKGLKTNFPAIMQDALCFGKGRFRAQPCWVVRKADFDLTKQISLTTIGFLKHERLGSQSGLIFHS